MSLEYKIKENRSRSKGSLFKHEFKSTQIESGLTNRITPIRQNEDRNENEGTEYAYFYGLMNVAYYKVLLSDFELIK